MSALIAKGKPYELSTANAIWGQKGFAWRPEFEKRVLSYGAGLRAADFETQAERERITINKWVEEQTRDRIHDLFAAGSLTSLTRMVLVNAVYFKGMWQDSFKTSATQKQPFTNADGTNSVASLMSRTGDYPLYQDADMQALVLPYKGKDLSMVVALPRKVDGLPALEAKLTEGSITKWYESAKNAYELIVQIPKFKLETSYTLNDSLISLGMADAFDSGADFTGMHSSDEKLFISLVVHKAYVDVNEEGTEAAAATGLRW